jgi:phage repressor protein C with HTH and peptisase S24 domain
MKTNSKQNVNSIVNKLKDFLNLKTDDDLAKVLGVTAPTISNWRRRGTINYDIIFEKIDNIDYNWLLYDQEIDKTNDYSKVKPKEIEINESEGKYVNSDVMQKLFDIEVYDVPAYASEEGLVVIEDYPKSIRKMNIGMNFNPHTHKAITIIGNSMEGSGIRAGDMILYSSVDKAYNNREIVARLNGALIVKTLKREGDKIVLYSNYAHETKPIVVGIDDNLDVIGVVVAIISYR